jgi:hypothetical protein
LVDGRAGLAGGAADLRPPDEAKGEPTMLSWLTKKVVTYTVARLRAGDAHRHRRAWGVELQRADAQSVAEVFKSWIDAGAQRLAGAGLPPTKARELTIAMLAALEGAFVLARALRSTRPLEIAGELAATAVQAALDG